MKINLIRNNCSIPKYKNTKIQSAPSFKSNDKHSPIDNLNHLLAIKGIISKRNLSEEEFYKNFLSKQGKTTPEECEDIIKNHPYTLSQCHKVCDREQELYSHPTSIAKIALGLKKYYDDLYDGNYTVVSIGRSPALISEVMQNLGAKVIFLPISNLRSMGDITHHPMRNIYPTYTSRFENIDTLMKYATKKGIAKKDAGKILVLDYTDTGTSLKIMKKVIEERGDIPKDNIIKHSLVDDVKKTRWQGYANIELSEIHALEKDLRMSYLSPLCNVMHYEYDESINSGRYSTNEIFKKFDNYSTYKAKCWALWVTSEALRLQNLQTK